MLKNKSFKILLIISFLLTSTYTQIGYTGPGYFADWVGYLYAFCRHRDITDDQYYVPIINSAFSSSAADASSSSSSSSSSSAAAASVGASGDIFRTPTSRSFHGQPESGIVADRAIEEEKKVPLLAAPRERVYAHTSLDGPVAASASRYVVRAASSSSHDLTPTEPTVSQRIMNPSLWSGARSGILSLHDDIIGGVIAPYLNPIELIQFASSHKKLTEAITTLDFSSLTERDIAFIDYEQLTYFLLNSARLNTLNLSGMPPDLVGFILGTLVQNNKAVASLKNLNLTNTGISDTVGLYIARLRNLNNLDLSHNVIITNKIAPYISGLHNLKSLNLNGTQATDTIRKVTVADVEVATVDNYRYLYEIASSTRRARLLSGATAAAIAKFLPRFLGDPVGTFFSYRDIMSIISSGNEGLVYNIYTQTTTLDFSLLTEAEINSINFEQLIYLLLGLEKLNTLDLSGMPPELVGFILGTLARNSKAVASLRDLNLENFFRLSYRTNSGYTESRDVTNAIGPLIYKFCNLKSLNLQETRVTDEIGPYIAGLHNLNSLNLAWTGVTDEIGPYISQLHNLNSLDLSYNHQITDEIGPYISQLHNLNSLGLSNERITGAIISKLAKLKNLKHLHLRMGFPISSDQLFEQLKLKSLLY